MNIKSGLRGIAALAIAVGAIIVAKVTGKAETINLDG